SCNGKITRAELRELPTPPATATHVPIPHAAVVETLVQTLNHRHIGVVDEEFAVSSDGMEMFGVLDLETSFDGCRFAIGIRNANNKRFRLACTVGLRVTQRTGGTNFGGWGCMANLCNPDRDIPNPLLAGWAKLVSVEPSYGKGSADLGRRLRGR